MAEGWISIHRRILEWEWYSDANTCRLFLHCLLRANHKEKKWRGVVIKRGEFISSIGILSQETGLSTQQTRTSISKLKSTNDLTSKSTNKSTVFSITNYDEYQETNKQDNKQITNEQQTNNKQITTNNNENNLNNDNKDIDHNLKKGEKLDWRVQDHLQQETVNELQGQAVIYGESLEILYEKFNNFIQFIPDKPDMAFAAWVKKWCNKKQGSIAKQEVAPQRQPPQNGEFDYLQWNGIRLSMAGSLAVSDKEKAYYEKHKTEGEAARNDMMKKAG